MLGRPKNRKVATVLALMGVLVPGLHKFYLGQPLWGIAYLALAWNTPISRVASLVEAIWYLAQNEAEFDLNFNTDPADMIDDWSVPAVDGTEWSVPMVRPKAPPPDMRAIADAMRQLDQLREDGLISEYEFEQKRRQLLDRIA